MEDNGARSNPQARVELSRLAELHVRLLAKAAVNRILPRSAPPRLPPVLETVTWVLEQAFGRCERVRFTRQPSASRAGRFCGRR